MARVVLNWAEVKRVADAAARKAVDDERKRRRKPSPKPVQPVVDDERAEE